MNKEKEEQSISIQNILKAYAIPLRDENDYNLFLL